jgi:hypothetical protein
MLELLDIFNQFKVKMDKLIASLLAKLLEQTFHLNILLQFKKLSINLC